jgi:hypothetical protein
MVKHNKDLPTIEQLLGIVGSKAINVNDGTSYSPYIIEIWAKLVTQDDSYDDLLKANIADMLFRYFINTTIPLNPNAKYFIRQGHDCVYLTRDRDGDAANKYHNYVIKTKSESGMCHVSRRRITESEASFLDDFLTEHDIDHTIYDNESQQN